MDKKPDILIIEDDETLLASLKIVLNRNAYNVEGAENADKAIDMAKNKKYDLIIADVRLPGGMNGIEAIRKIKDIRGMEKFSVIFMTGYSDHDALMQAKELGADDFLSKPFELKCFLDSIKNSLAKPKT